MIGQLTKRERRLALVILCVVAVLGLLMMAAGRNDPLGAQGGLVALMALFAISGVISGYFSPDPGDGRLNYYYDEPSRVGIVFSTAWLIFGLLVGDWVAWILVDPNLTFDAG